MAPPCADWTWMNSYTSGRYLSIWGHTAKSTVKRTNLMAHVVAMLMWLCKMRGVHYFIEQPKSSKLFGFPLVREALRQTKGHRTTTHQGHFGGSLPKATWMVHNMSKGIVDKYLVRKGRPKVKDTHAWYLEKRGTYKGPRW